MDDSQLEVRGLFHDEVLYVSADPDATRRPVTVGDLAAAPLILYDISYGFDDPTRRQLARRVQEAGVGLEPRIEVEHVETALQMVARGLGATMVARAVLNGSVVPESVTAVGFAEPFYDFFALVTRRGVRLSPGINEFVELIDDWARGVGARLQRGLSAAVAPSEP